jgi:hypothetical protein
MAQAGLHINTITGEILSKTTQWCGNCGQNFSSTRAGDKHRVGNFFPDGRKCLTGEDAGLTGVINKKRGTKVYRL